MSHCVVTGKKLDYENHDDMYFDIPWWKHIFYKHPIGIAKCKCHKAPVTASDPRPPEGSRYTYHSIYPGNAYDGMTGIVEHLSEGIALNCITCTLIIGNDW